MAFAEKHVEETLSSSPINADETSDHEVFGNEASHQIRYRTITWPFAAFIMTTEIVTVGTLGFPQAFAVVGLVPGLIVSIFCGVFALYTALLLIDFKLNHPEVHNMGDAGYILMSPFKLGWLGREVLSTGAILFAICSVGAMQLTGGLAISTLADHTICAMGSNGIYAAAILILSIPRTFDFGLHWLSALACACVVVSCIVAMVGAGVEPTLNREVAAVQPQGFYTAFLTITNPVIAYAGHFMFFPLISEMKKPVDAKKSAWFLQIFSTSFYVLFGTVTYVYLGSTVTNPSFLSLSTVWSKVSWGIMIPNMLIAGALYNHVAAKIVFVRIFRNTRHLHSHTVLAWTVWITLLILSIGAAFVLATGVSVFYLLAGLCAAAFASWYTYGLAGAFWWHDTHFLGHAQAYKYPHQGFARGRQATRKHWLGFTVAFLTLMAGAFICIAGLYAIIKSLADTYASGQAGPSFSC